MLVGRDLERRQIEQLVAAARVGESGVLVLTGEAGIGKTALLEHAATVADGVRTLRATGAESDHDVPFGGLAQLLRPALAELDRIPAPQADALAVALALRHGAAHDRLAVGAATLSLVSRYAEAGPLFVLVDDAHLVDRPSVDALTFAFRRLVAEPIAVLAAVRTGELSPLLAAGVPVLELTGMGAPDAGELIASRSGRRPPPDVLARVHRATAGNPLAILELSGDLAGFDAMAPEPLVPVPETIAGVFVRRTEQLSPSARTALLLATIAGGDLAVASRAAAAVRTSVPELAEAERAGLVHVAGGKVEFRHPLVRSAVYGAAAPASRRAVHAAVAAALPHYDVDRRAWHLSESTLGTDEDAAATVEAVGLRARERSAHSVAATSFERAARLSPADAERARRYVAAAEASWAAGQPDRAVAALDVAASLPSGLTVRANRLRAEVAARCGSLEEAYDLLVTTAADVALTAPDTAVVLLAEAVNCCFYLGNAAKALVAAERITGLLTDHTGARTRLVGEIATGMAHVLAGTGGVTRIRQAAAPLAAQPDLLDDLSPRSWPVLAALWLRESGTGRELAQQIVDERRDQVAVGELPHLLFHVARDDATTDRWARAESTYTEAILLARETGQATELAASLSGLAWLQARLGRAEECRRNVAEASDLCRLHHLDLGRAWGLFTLGELELGAGRPGDALERFEELTAALAEIGVQDVDLEPGAELVEVHLRLGHADEAAAVAHAYAARAERKGQPWARARAERALGMCAGGAAFDAHFAAALELHARTPDAFEDARTRLAYGVALRRARRRVDARPLLRAALAAFDRLGARPWADLAATELKATGETARRRASGGVDELTPQEMQIALMLADGRTTRQAAAALFLSPKTVDYHLRHVYTKLGIHSRTELAAAMRA